MIILIKNVDTNLCMDIEDASTADGVDIRQSAVTAVSGNNSASAKQFYYDK